MDRSKIELFPNGGLAPAPYAKLHDKLVRLLTELEKDAGPDDLFHADMQYGVLDEKTAYWGKIQRYTLTGSAGHSKMVVLHVGFGPEEYDGRSMSFENLIAELQRDTAPPKKPLRAAAARTS